VAGGAGGRARASVMEEEEGRELDDRHAGPHEGG
jgi:hypothetical protein